MATQKSKIFWKTIFLHVFKCSCFLFKFFFSFQIDHRLFICFLKVILSAIIPSDGSYLMILSEFIWISTLTSPFLATKIYFLLIFDYNLNEMNVLMNLNKSTAYLFLSEYPYLISFEKYALQKLTREFVNCIKRTSIEKKNLWRQTNKQTVNSLNACMPGHTVIQSENVIIFFQVQGMICAQNEFYKKSTANLSLGFARYHLTMYAFHFWILTW